MCLLIGAASGGITETSVHTWYLTLSKPPLTPPNWAFPIAWAALYVMVGVSGWLVWRRVGATPAIRLWGWQILVNALWTPAFFGLHRPDLALAIIAGLIVVIVLTIRAFRPISRPAAALMLPYLAWTVFAAYLNAGFWWLNQA